MVGISSIDEILSMNKDEFDTVIKGYEYRRYFERRDKLELVAWMRYGINSEKVNWDKLFDPTFELEVLEKGYEKAKADADKKARDEQLVYSRINEIMNKGG